MPAYDAHALEEIVSDYTIDARFVRISPAKYSASPLTYGNTPSRFSGPPTVADPTLATFGALYLAETVKTATCETLIHSASGNRVDELPPSALTSRVIFVYKRSRQAIKALDLREDNSPIAGINPKVIHEKKHLRAQKLSEFVWNNMPHVNGIVYPSWYTGEDCLALYASGVDKIIHDYTEELFLHDDVYDALDRYHVTLKQPS